MRLRGGAADFAEVVLNLAGGAVAFFAGVGEVTAGTGVEGADEHELGGEGDGHFGAGDVDAAVFHGLAEDFECAALELGEFVEEEDAVVGEADFSGLGNGAAADESDVADGMVGRAEGAGGDE